MDERVGGRRYSALHELRVQIKLSRILYTFCVKIRLIRARGWLVLRHNSFQTKLQKSIPYSRPYKTRTAIVRPIKHCDWNISPYFAWTWGQSSLGSVLQSRAHLLPSLYRANWSRSSQLGILNIQYFKLFFLQYFLDYM